jgi:Lon protease-like protein
MSELPLFPLRAVLLPAGRLALRVFEPRYLDMVARCLRGENRFGVVAIREGGEVGAATTYDAGTSAEIVDWHQESDGMLGLVAAGRTPFRLLATRREPDGLYVGEVVWLEPLPPLPLPPEHDPLRGALSRWLDRVPRRRVGRRPVDRAAAARARAQAVVARDRGRGAATGAANRGPARRSHEQLNLPAMVGLPKKGPWEPRPS